MGGVGAKEEGYPTFFIPFPQLRVKLTFVSPFQPVKFQLQITEYKLQSDTFSLNMHFWLPACLPSVTNLYIPKSSYSMCEEVYGNMIKCPLKVLTEIHKRIFT